LNVQNSSGGFATFARTEREKQGLLGTAEGPGAQQMSLFDAPAADSTSWAIQGLSALGSRAARRRPAPFVRLRKSVLNDIDQAIERGLGWLRRDFHVDAGWWARYGGGYVAGTRFGVEAFRRAGASPKDPVVTRAAYLLKRAQNPDGGWGQTPDADDPKHNKHPGRVAMVGRSDPELTGHAISGLLDAVTLPTDESVLRGIQYLLDAAPRAEGDDGKPLGFRPIGTPHTFMRGWNYKDQAHTDLIPTEALLRFYLLTEAR
jgi:hypothetical protein